MCSLKTNSTVETYGRTVYNPDRRGNKLGYIQVIVSKIIIEYQLKTPY